MQKRSVYFLIVIILILAIFGYFYSFQNEVEKSPESEFSEDTIPSKSDQQINNLFPYEDEDQREEIPYPAYPVMDGLAYEEKLEEQQYNGYIIRLKESPLAETYSKNKDSPTLANKLNEQKSKIEIQQVNLKQKLNNFRSNIEIKNEFTKVSNSIVVSDLTENEIIMLESEGYRISPNYQVKATLMDSVPLINADDVWQLNAQGKPCKARPYNNNIAVRAIQTQVFGEETCITGKGVKIGIIDTGVDYSHSDLGGCFGAGCKVIDGWDFVNNDNDPMDDHGHGTHVAATAAGKGVLKGVAPDAGIVAYKVLDQYGSGWEDNIIAAIERSIDPNQDGNFSDHLNVVSMSLGVSSIYFNDCYELEISNASDNAAEMGVVVIVAAGNEGGFKKINAPGCARKVVTVGASDKQDNIASFSSKGPTTDFRIKPDIVAPGVDICAAEYDNAWSWLRCLDENHVAISGTSMATPHVSGTIALILQAHSDWTPDEIKHALRNNAIDLNESILSQGYGRIDAKATVFSQKPPVAELWTSGIVSGIINVTGYVHAEDFQSYKIEYGQDLEPTTWITLFESQAIPTNNLLYENWNTEMLEDSLYKLKLTAYTTEGKISTDETLVIIANNPAKNFNCSSCFECNLFSEIPGANIFLERDIIEENTRNCIEIKKDDVLIDCQGHSISGQAGPDDLYSIGITSYLPNIHNKNTKVRNCFIKNFSKGIKIQYSDNTFLSNNDLRNNGIGIYLWMSKNGSLRENHLINSGYGEANILVYGTDKIYWNHSIDTSNYIDNYPVRYLFNVKNLNLTGLNSGQIHIAYGDNVIINNNSVWGDGIILSNTNNTLIINNNIIINGSVSGIRVGYYTYLNEVKNQNYRIENNIVRNIAPLAGVALAIRDSNFTANYTRKIINNTFISPKIGAFEGAFKRGVFLNGYKIDFIGNNVSSYYCAFESFIQKANIEYNLFVTNSSCGMVFNSLYNSSGPIPVDSKVTHNIILSKMYAVKIFADTAFEASYENKGNYWGRSILPYFCEYGNQNESCINNWNSYRPDVIDSCPYNQSYPPGEWPESPVCPSLCPPGHINNGDGTCTAIFTSGNGDGDVYNWKPQGQQPPWNIIHDATNGYGARYFFPVAIVAYIYASYDPPLNQYSISRAFLPFNTSVIPDNADIVSATLSFETANWINNEANDGNDFITIVQTSQANPNLLITEDYDQCGAVNNPIEGGERIDISLMSSYSSYNLTLNEQGKSWINDEGWTLLGLREGHDTLNIPPANKSGLNIRTDNKPKLIVNYVP